MRKYPFHIAVCDDEEADREQIRKMAEEVCRAEKIRAEIVCYGTAKELLEEIQNGKEYALLLLDVLMPAQDGMELARALRNQKVETEIVFISSNREMALQGYEVAAARYLAKPLEIEKLTEAVRFCYGKLRSCKELLLPADGYMRKIAPKEIYYIEIIGRKSRIMQETQEWDTSLSMKELEEMLSGQGFVRCHQSFLVNFSHVKNFRTSSMELTDGRSVPVSKHRVKEVRQAFFDYMKS
ncbi:MAG: LytR/AlgR family response regulator transcription factor [Marvinbryantia sp.]|uniref:LytR/AlgR family response regulator transcription factor n=1 Tax=Marvinbryantia sp. TaxID=2496532 RepID=UPI00399A843B